MILVWPARAACGRDGHLALHLTQSCQVPTGGPPLSRSPWPGARGRRGGRGGPTSRSLFCTSTVAAAALHGESSVLSARSSSQWRQLLFGITSNTLVRSSQSSSGPAGGASDGYYWLGRGAAGPDRRCAVRLPRQGVRQGHSESSFRTDPSVCPITDDAPPPVPIGNGVTGGPESVRNG